MLHEEEEKPIKINKECIFYIIVLMASAPILIMSWSDRSSLSVELPSWENSLFGTASRELGISLGRFGYSFAVSLALIQ